MTGCVGAFLWLRIKIGCVIGNEYLSFLAGRVAIKFSKKFCFIDLRSS